jgi:hypothetical protein
VVGCTGDGKRSERRTFRGGARPLLSPVPGEAEVSEGESKGWGTSEGVAIRSLIGHGAKANSSPTAPGYNCPRRFQIRALDLLKPQLLRPAAMSV